MDETGQHMAVSSEQGRARRPKPGPRREKPLKGHAADAGVQVDVLTLTFLEAWDQFVNNILHGSVMTAKKNRTGGLARSINSLILERFPFNNNKLHNHKFGVLVEFCF